MKKGIYNVASFVFCTVAGVVLTRITNDLYDYLKECAIKKQEEKRVFRIGFM